MPKKTRKLALSKETLRDLQDSHLKDVVGGQRETYGCPVYTQPVRDCWLQSLDCPIYIDTIAL